jgi:hypothetical protein
MSITIERTQGPAQLALSDEEGRLLYDCENQIADSIDAVHTAGLRIGAGLLEIARKRLYRTTHATIESYAWERWGLKERRLYELKAAAERLEVVQPIFCDFSQPPKVREAHLLPLKDLTSPEVQRAAFRTALQRAGEAGRDLTAKDVKAAVRELSPPEPKALPLGNGAEPENPYHCSMCGDDHLPTVPCREGQPPTSAEETARIFEEATRPAREAAEAEKAQARLRPCEKCGRAFSPDPDEVRGLSLCAECRKAPRNDAGGQETASAPIGQSREGGGAKAEDFAVSAPVAGAEDPPNALPLYITPEEARWIHADGKTIREVLETARRIYAAAEKCGCSTLRLLEKIEQPSFAGRNRLGAGK